ncbi:MAG: hypothetical protein JXB49_37590 [Bacteroidales bacterium]|nr:hypothetical protein [Bacteroidales bacterium]
MDKRNASLDVKKTHLFMLMYMKEVDRSSHQNEERFLLNIAHKMGLSEADIEDVKRHPENINITYPSTMEERMTFFYHLLFMMKIDGKVDEVEKELCRKIGFRLCLNPALMDELIDIMADYANRDIPDEVMLQATLKYLN